MPRSVRLSEKAARDLDAARLWLTQAGAGSRAQRKLDAVQAALDELGRHPCRWPREAQGGTRYRVVAGYRLTYRVTPDTDDNLTAGDVRVLRVFDPGQDRSVL